MQSFDPTEFTTPTAKPLPVVLLLDISGSMKGAKIQNLNDAVKNMLDTFRQMENGETEIHVAIITFGDEVKLHQSIASVSSIAWHDLLASGGTPLGTACKMAKAMIEDRSIFPSRAYRPTVVLVSDGQPTDDWEQPMKSFITDGRSSKCFRMAMAIGADADESVLGKFTEGTTNPLFYAENAGQLHEFFKLVTMSITVRSVSKNKDAVPELSTLDAQPATIVERPIERSETEKAEHDTMAPGEESEGGYW
jgi:uncharacterized protein YegL